MAQQEILAKFDKPERKMGLTHVRERCGLLCKTYQGMRIHQTRSVFCKEQEEPDAKADAEQ